jgi:hypothetical protein
VDPVPDPLLLRKSGGAGNGTRDLRDSSQELCWVSYKELTSFSEPEIFLMDPTEQVSPFLHLRTETYPVSETLCFVVFRIPDYGQSPETR